MTHELEIIVRDPEMRPRAGVDVRLAFGRKVHVGITDALGIVRFRVPDIGTGTLIVEGVRSVEPVRLIGGRVRQISVMQAPLAPKLFDEA